VSTTRSGRPGTARPTEQVLRIDREPSTAASNPYPTVRFSGRWRAVPIAAAMMHAAASRAVRRPAVSGSSNDAERTTGLSRSPMELAGEAGVYPNPEVDSPFSHRSLGRRVGHRLAEET
jgi:hypothetical protein